MSLNEEIVTQLLHTLQVSSGANKRTYYAAAAAELARIDEELAEITGHIKVCDAVISSEAKKINA